VTTRRGQLGLTLGGVVEPGAGTRATISLLSRSVLQRLENPVVSGVILSSMRYINVASIEASTLYRIPNDSRYALASDDLKHPTFQHLRLIA